MGEEPFLEVEFALPRELNEPERRDVASDFDWWLLYTVAIDSGNSQDENPLPNLEFSEHPNDNGKAPHRAVVQALWS